MAGLSRYVDPFVTGIKYYYLTSFVVVLGVCFSVQVLQNQRAYQPEQDVLSRFANWDGDVYVRIAENGYSYWPDANNDSAFLPIFPLLGRWVAWATGMPTVAALVLVAHLSLAATLVVLVAYLQARAPEQPAKLTNWTLLAFGLLPTTFFFRIAYR